MRTKRLGILVLVLLTGGLLAPPPADANSYGRRCTTFLTDTNAEATVCAFVDNVRFKGFRGAGTIKVDRGTAKMQIESVSLTLDGQEVARAGRKDADAPEMDQRTGFVKRHYGKYQVAVNYRIGDGDGWRESTVISDVYDYYYDDSPGNPA